MWSKNWNHTNFITLQKIIFKWRILFGVLHEMPGFKGGTIELIGCGTVQDHHLFFFAPQFSTRLLLNYSRSFGFSLKKCTFWDAMHIFSAIFLQTHVLLSRATFVFCDHTSVWFCSFQAQHKKQEKFLLPNFLVRNSVWKHCECQQMVAFNSSGSN